MWSDYLLVATLLVCVITDIKERKIYNAVLFPALCTAWILHVITGGSDGLYLTLLGTLVGFSLLLIPYLLGGMGAGDVKLLAVIGAIKGMMFVLMAAVYMALAGGLMAFLILVFHKGLKKRLLGIVYFLNGLRNGIRMPIMTNSDSMKTTYPYGVAIAAGALYQIINQYGGLPL
ncbi:MULTISPECIES: prepilin peptidase [unclassified Bacillus (in: firmicutes)]|uniref:A24 family peptidase n=1 Tax=unclassified Bacillus (in: firmicutes) TaxID=185979 RepID=UPI0008F24161|nr:MULTISPECIES: prepilin peptidase [unclassified Bacillus (in: firmicutes)]SFA79383.1 prepilin peptidase CpaA [Bacillus sp. UNCCL13]SFQ69373.1 prepilin peptidase CpaA [Bacillus sp. cl95]